MASPSTLRTLSIARAPDAAPPPGGWVRSLARLAPYRRRSFPRIAAKLENFFDPAPAKSSVYGITRRESKTRRIRDASPMGGPVCEKDNGATRRLGRLAVFPGAAAVHSTDRRGLAIG
jgi:hypothetical protein